MLHSGAVAALAQTLLIAEQFRNGAHDANCLIGQDECIEAHCKLRIGRKGSAHTERVANLAIMLNGSEADVIDLRMSAPRRAACDRDFEFAWQVIEVGVCLEKIRYLKSQRRGADRSEERRV